jgi:hypothetical protein
MESIAHKNTGSIANRVRELIGACAFGAWEFHVIERGEEVYLQLAWEAPCSDRGELNLQKSRKWFVSRHATDSEVVATAFKAVITALEHEAREEFTYCGKPIFHAHQDINLLLSICDHKDARKEPA